MFAVSLNIIYSPLSRVAMVAATLLFVNPSVFGAIKDSVAIGGDLRLRTEGAAIEGKDTDRIRQRIRARIKLAGKVAPNISLKFQIASGGEAVASTNQSFTGGGSNKSFDLDQAYFDWDLTPATQLLGGKVVHKFYALKSSDLIWDHDLTPEGIVLNYSRDTGALRVFSHLVSFWLHEESDDGISKRDVGVFGGQLGGSLRIANVPLTLGFGLYEFAGMENSELFVGNKFLGNSSRTNFNGDLVYANGYKLVEFFISVDGQFGNRRWKLYADVVKNSVVDENNGAFLVGVTYGKIKTAGDFKLNYNYRVVEKDAIVGFLSDGDFIGGGTNGQGHKVAVTYGLGQQTSLAAVYFADETNIAANEVRKKFEKIQLDIKFKF